MTVEAEPKVDWEFKKLSYTASSRSVTQMMLAIVHVWWRRSRSLSLRRTVPQHLTE